MKITKRQLRRIIRESISDLFLDHDPDYDHDDPFEDRVPAEIHEYHDFLEELGMKPHPEPRIFAKFAVEFRQPCFVNFSMHWFQFNMQLKPSQFYRNFLSNQDKAQSAIQRGF